MQIKFFGAGEVVKILNCSPSTARKIMLKLREIEVVREVKGKGKGKYRFVNADEVNVK